MFETIHVAVRPKLNVAHCSRKFMYHRGPGFPAPVRGDTNPGSEYNLTVSSGGSRISQRGRQHLSGGGANLLFDQFFFWRLRENLAKWGTHPCAPLDPPMVRDLLSRITGFLQT